MSWLGPSLASDLIPLPHPLRWMRRAISRRPVRGTMPRMDAVHADIFTEPADVDPDTLKNLGPLRPMAGIWQGRGGKDDHPAAEGGEKDDFVERVELQPIDPQLNGPQLFYGLRYHVHIVKPGEVETFHDQVGYWLWEPATKTVSHTLAIPRGQVAFAAGIAEPDAKELEVTATAAAAYYGSLSNPFLETASQPRS